MARGEPTLSELYATFDFHWRKKDLKLAQEAIRELLKSNRPTAKERAARFILSGHSKYHEIYLREEIKRRKPEGSTRIRELQLPPALPDGAPVDYDLAQRCLDFARGEDEPGNKRSESTDQ